MTAPYCCKDKLQPAKKRYAELKGKSSKSNFNIADCCDLQVFVRVVRAIAGDARIRPSGKILLSGTVFYKDNNR
jgi:hypothetical protein